MTTEFSELGSRMFIVMIEFNTVEAALDNIGTPHMISICYGPNKAPMITHNLVDALRLADGMAEQFSTSPCRYVVREMLEIYSAPPASTSPESPESLDE